MRPGGMIMRRGMRGVGGPGGYPGPGGNYTPQIQNPRPIPGSGGQLTEDFFTYTVALASLLAGATANSQVTIQADSNFEWVETTVSANLDGNTDDQNLDNINIPIVVTVTDGGSGRQLMNVPVPLSGLAGTGKQPFILPVPRMFAAKSTIVFVFTSFSANKWDNIYFNLIGRKIFNLGNQSLTG